MAGPYPSFNLQMVNLFIGMCRGEPSLPRVFLELGYQDGWVEFQFDGTAGAVRPELVVWSEQQAHTIMWEWKSGGNLLRDQMERYRGVTADDLQQRTMAPALACEKHDTGLVVPERKAPDASRVLGEWGFAYPLLARQDNGLRLAAHAFHVRSLNDAFSPVLEVDFEQLPLGFVPFDVDSPDWVVAQFTVRRLVEHMHERSPRVEAGLLAGEIVPAWGSLGRDMRSRYVKRVVSALREMATGEFLAYLRSAPRLKALGATPAWDIVNNPLEVSTDRRTAAFRDIQKQAARLVERLRHGQPLLPGTDE